MKHLLLLTSLLITLSSCSFFKQSGGDTRNVNGMEFSTLTLPNKLDVLVVHDPRFQKSSAAMAVMVGSMEDPKNAEGMAHYLEHMLFLGTKTYPNPSEYSQFMQTNGGWDNAYTSDEITNYMFEVDNAVMEEALKRFSRFFVEPLFDSQYVDREKNAVNSEFEKNLKSDGWRKDRFINTLAKSEHPYGKFSTGSTETLKNVTRDELMTFHKKYYSSNNMKLVIMSAQPMEKLKDWAQKYFVDIPSANTQRPKYEDMFFVSDAKERLHFIKSIADTEEITVLFNIPDTTPFWASKPTEVLSEILGHEGKGSLLSYLIAKGWALRLNTSTSFWRTFGVSITLTPAGRANYEKVLAAVFQYIEMVKKQKYSKDYYEILKGMAQIDLDNLEPSASGNYAAEYARQMTDHPVNEFLEREYLFSKFSVEDLQIFLDKLTPENAHVLIMSKNEKTDKKENIFGVEYKSEPLTLVSTDEDMGFLYPEKSKYVPTQFDLLSGKSMGTPKAMDMSDKGKLYFQQDTELGIPKANVSFKILSDIDSNPRNLALINLYARSKKEELREWSYPIERARYDFAIYPMYANELALYIEGYSQHIFSVFKDIVDNKENSKKLTAVVIDEKTFQDVKQKYKKDLLNVDEAVASSRLGMSLTALSSSKGIESVEALKEIDKITLKDVQAFAQEFYKKINVKAVIYGNAAEKDAAQAFEYLFSSLGASAIPADILPTRETQYRVIPEGQRYAMLVKGKNNNHAMFDFYRIADWSIENQARAAILSQIISQPYFAELRTTQQLGYVANGAVGWSSGFIGLRGILQSGKYPSLELAERSDKFMNDFLKKHLETVNEDALKPVKTSLVNELLTRPNTLGERFSVFANGALQYDRFNLNADVAEKIKGVSVEDYKNFIKANFFDRKPARLTLYYSGQTSTLGKSQLPGKGFEKVSEVEWQIMDPYKVKKAQ